MCKFFVQICHTQLADQYLESLKARENSPSGSYSRLISWDDLEEALSLDNRYRDRDAARLFLQKLVVAGMPVYLFKVCMLPHHSENRSV